MTRGKPSGQERHTNATKGADSVERSEGVTLSDTPRASQGQIESSVGPIKRQTIGSDRAGQVKVMR